MGLIVDVKFNPLNYIEPATRNPLYVLQFVSTRSDLLGASNLLEQAALDKYSFVRDAYSQQRRARLRGTGENAAPLPNYDDEGGDSGAAAPAAGAPAALPNYADPGDAAQAPNAASGSATGAPAGVPNYTDPGDTPPAPNAASGSAPGAAPGVPNYTDPGETPNTPAASPAAASGATTPAPAPQTVPTDKKPQQAIPATQ
jgi:phospholipid-binding lipoprotein MlaA